MKCKEQNRKLVGNIGDLVELLYDEVASLPISEEAKSALVMMMMGDMMKRNGSTVTFLMPAFENSGEVAAA